MTSHHPNKHRSGSPASILMGHHHHKHEAGCNPAKVLMGGHYADGGAPSMVPGAARSMPNPGNHFATGGHAKHHEEHEEHHKHHRKHYRAEGGQMQMEDHLRSEGRMSGKGSEMNKEDRLRRAEGGDIGTNTGSSTARNPGVDSEFKKGGRPKMMKRAMGGAGKTRKGYPFT